MQRLIGDLFLRRVSWWALITLGSVRLSSLNSTESITWFQNVGNPLALSYLCSDLLALLSRDLHKDSLCAAHTLIVSNVLSPPVCSSKWSLIPSPLCNIELLRGKLSFEVFSPFTKMLGHPFVEGFFIFELSCLSIGTFEVVVKYWAICLDWGIH